jgi:hypothetical protein
MPVGNFKCWTMKMVVVILAAISSAFGQDALSLSSGSVVAGQTISLDLSLSAPSGGGPAGLEWTYNYPAATFSSIAVVAGPAAAAAGKSVSCSAGSGSYTCMLFGLNTTTMNPGVVATATFTASPAATGTFPIQILNSTGVTPTDALVGVTATGGTVTITSPYAVSGLACAPAMVTTPGSAACTVALSAPAPSGGLTVMTALVAGSGITMPASVLVPAGMNSVNFTANASAVTANTSAVLAASLNGTSQNFTLMLTPPPVTLTGLACSPTLLTAHGSATCNITLSAAAPAGGLNIAIHLTNAVSLSVPSSITAAAGSTSVTFSIVAGGVNSNQTTTLLATLNGSSVSITLTLSGSKHHH